MKKRFYKDKRYKVYSFRLNDKTVEGLAILRGGLTWNKFFLNIINEKTGISCYFCGTHNNLEKHHVIAIKDGGKDEPKNIINLCYSCHKKTDNWGNKIY